MNIVPKDYFGIVERFSVFAATGYNAVLGIELYRMKFQKVKNMPSSPKIKKEDMLQAACGY